MRLPVWFATILLLFGACQSGSGGADDGGANRADASTFACGNGVVDPLEECDDGVDNSDTAPDACRGNCQLASCGDGVIDTGETCDDGNLGNDDGCLSAGDGANDRCVPNVCGDGFVDASGDGAGGQIEACDDGNTVGGDDCRGDCGQDMTLCGNDTVDQGEACDDGALNSDTTPNACRTNCQLPGCGDGVLESGEECDDGNPINEDDCLSACTALFDCCLLNVCGDNFTNELPDGLGGQIEACDDGNTVDGDSCRGDCGQDFTMCGNGALDQGEECDDGAANSDTAPNVCRLTCVSPSCGDLVPDDALGEQCDDANATDWDGCNTCVASEFQVNTEAQGIQQLPAIAAAGDGSTVAVWTSAPSTTTFIRGQRLDTLGNPNGTELTANSSTFGIQIRSDVAMASDGRFVVIMERSVNPVSNQIFARLFDATGSPVGSDIQITNVGVSLHPRVAMADDGTFVAIWERLGVSPTFYDLFLERFDAAGLSITGPVQVNTFTADNQQFAAIAAAPDGRFVVAWRSYFQAGSFGGIYAQRYDATASPVGTEFEVHPPTTEDSDNPDVAMAADGSFVVVWDTNLSFVDTENIHGQRFDSSGNPTGPELLIALPSGPQIEPAVAMAGDGRFVVVWHDANQGASVFGQLFDASGQTVGAEFPVNGYATNAQHMPDVAMADDGSFTVVWETDDLDGDLRGVYAKRFDSLGNPIGIGQ